jgi:hypothetical protein
LHICEIAKKFQFVHFLQNKKKKKIIIKIEIKNRYIYCINNKNIILDIDISIMFKVKIHNFKKNWSLQDEYKKNSFLYKKHKILNLKLFKKRKKLFLYKKHKIHYICKNKYME